MLLLFTIAQGIRRRSTNMHLHGSVLARRDSVTFTVAQGSLPIPNPRYLALHVASIWCKRVDRYRRMSILPGCWRMMVFMTGSGITSRIFAQERNLRRIQLSPMPWWMHRDIQ